MGVNKHCTSKVAHVCMGSMVNKEYRHAFEEDPTVITLVQFIAHAIVQDRHCVRCLCPLFINFLLWSLIPSDDTVDSTVIRPNAATTGSSVFGLRNFCPLHLRLNMIGSRPLPGEST
ncbi:hypothetical protein DPMN_120842 [Dreissena polymorpha]|uniref:Uncharacterized protein n=1 Tax=Dreissena polymorpha TaxID=45954 RepID=A0A9D4JQI6_DREPO|nr:hypothetical protein DPMN_120842 [Dreissena polymorpha]